MKFILVLLSLLAMDAQAQRFIIETPQVNLQSEIAIDNPDERLSQLGRVSFVLDFASASDNLLMLKIRRHEFTLPDGRKAHALAVREGDGLIIGAAQPVQQISIVGIEYAAGRRVIRAIFYGANNQIVSPASSDIAVFNLSFTLQNISYEPTGGSHPGNMSVSLLLDNSGSMQGFQDQALSAASEFLENLPSFTRCNVFVFSDEVKRISTDPAPPCPGSRGALSKVDPASGGTALLNALEAGFMASAGSSELPSLVIAVTDGVNTVNPRLSGKELADLKVNGNSKAVIYWIGAHDPDHLRGIVDQEISGRASVKSDLEDFFETIGVSISGIQSIQLL